MDGDTVAVERRRSARRAVDLAEPLSHAKLRAGPQLRVIDASNWGALAETRERLLPGRHLDLHVVATTGRMLVRARVTRVWVWRLQADAIDYRAAFAFEQSVDVRADGYPIPEEAGRQAAAQGTDYPTRPPMTDIEFTEPLSA